MPQKVLDLPSPTALPSDDATAKRWQDANKEWWESNPMRYDWREEIGHEPGTRAYFEEIDRRFFAAARQYLPETWRPFDALIDFASLRTRDVLEIGVGHGSHAGLIAPYCKSFTGIDLTERAARMTGRRFEVMGLHGRVLQMDAEQMSFPDGSFDSIWSWGVIHHSSNTRRVLEEMTRVLRPGGTATVMVYHRSPWRFLVEDGLLKGVLRGDLFRLGSLVSVNQAATDGAIARFYTEREWVELVQDLFVVERIRIVGQKTEALPLPAGRFKTFATEHVPSRLTRAFTNDLRMGSFLVADMRRR